MRGSTIDEAVTAACVDAPEPPIAADTVRPLRGTTVLDPWKIADALIDRALARRVEESTDDEAG